MKKLSPGEAQGQADVSGTAEIQVTWLQSGLSLTQFNSNSARVRLQSMSSYRSPSHVLSGAVLQVVIITIVLSISQVRKPGFTKWQMETPEFKSNLTASKAPSFVVFLPLKLEALAMDTKLAPRCREAWSPQLTSLADTESVRSRDQ